jgi:hypothetical protein
MTRSCGPMIRMIQRECRIVLAETLSTQCKPVREGVKWCAMVRYGAPLTL